MPDQQGKVQSWKSLYIGTGSYKEGKRKTFRVNRSNALASNEHCAAHATLLVGLLSYYLKSDLGDGEELPLGTSDRRRQGSRRVAISKGVVQVAICQMRHIDNRQTRLTLEPLA